MIRELRFYNVKYYLSQIIICGFQFSKVYGIALHDLIIINAIFYRSIILLNVQASITYTDL